MKNYRAILLSGPPGSGKGTQGKALGALSGFFHFSCGDVFRSLDLDTELGRAFLHYSGKGLLVPDDITIRLWMERIKHCVESGRYKPETDRLVLDGIPRNVRQAALMEEMVEVEHVFHLTGVAREQIAQRLKKRALKENRLDDASDEVVQHRLAIYEQESESLIGHYAPFQITTVHAVQPAHLVLHQILTTLTGIEPPSAGSVPQTAGDTFSPPEGALKYRSPSHISDEEERTIEFDFVRATENAALNSLQWLGRGDKNSADAAACDAVHGVFDVMDCCGTVVIGEGIKDNAPGIFIGARLGRWRTGSPHFDIAIDPIDGTTNIAAGQPNCISVIAASATPSGESHSMRYLRSFYAEKLAWGPLVSRHLANTGGSICLDDPIRATLDKVAAALGKNVSQLVVCSLNRPRQAEMISQIRETGAALRLVTDGDITAALAPSMADSGVDLYIGIGGSTEAVLTAAALKTLGGEMLVRMWPHDAAERADLIAHYGEAEMGRVFRTGDLVSGTSAIFCATGISDSPLLPGIRTEGGKVVTTSILLRAHSRTVRYIRTAHDLEHKYVPLRSLSPRIIPVTPP